MDSAPPGSGMAAGASEGSNGGAAEASDHEELVVAASEVAIDDPPPEIKACPSDRRAEYVEVNSNIRHYSSLRFAIITVFFAATGGIASVAFNLFGVDRTDVFVTKLATRVAGFLITLLFLQYEWLVGSVLAHNRKIGSTLEELMNLSQIRNRSTKRVAVAHWFARGLYALFAIFWAYMIWEMLRPVPAPCDDCV